MNRRDCTTLSGVIAAKDPHDWIVEVLVRVPGTARYETKIVEHTPDPRRAVVVDTALRLLGLRGARQGTYFVKSAKLRKDRK